MAAGQLLRAPLVTRQPITRCPTGQHTFPLRSHYIRFGTRKQLPITNCLRYVLPSTSMSTDITHRQLLVQVDCELETASKSLVGMLNLSATVTKQSSMAAKSEHTTLETREICGPHLVWTAPGTRLCTGRTRIAAFATTLGVQTSGLAKSRARRACTALSTVGTARYSTLVTAGQLPAALVLAGRVVVLLSSRQRLLYTPS